MQSNVILILIVAAIMGLSAYVFILFKAIKLIQDGQTGYRRCLKERKREADAE